MHVHIYCSAVVKSSGGDRVIEPIQKALAKVIKVMFVIYDHLMSVVSVIQTCPSITVRTF